MRALETLADAGANLDALYCNYLDAREMLGERAPRIVRPMVVACKTPWLEGAEFLYLWGCSLGDPDGNGNRQIDAACASRDPEMCRWVLGGLSLAEVQEVTSELPEPLGEEAEAADGLGALWRQEQRVWNDCGCSLGDEHSLQQNWTELRCGSLG